MSGKITLQELFGVSANQNNQTVQIAKEDLTGLTSLLNNPAEAILAAIILTANNAFEGDLVDENGISIVDETGTPLSYDQSSLYSYLQISFWGVNLVTRASKQYKQYTLLVDFFVTPPPDINSTLNPNSF